VIIQRIATGASLLEDFTDIITLLFIGCTLATECGAILANQIINRASRDSIRQRHS
jgi:hypothetical protein